ncbi:MAG: neutral/alkaline non-lysosomal ceramidase N-terminal domain-containing protein [Sedimentisphaerales bacterium]|nr:neutral/alkaline non-lysosomal ceramidase N-terminal domain-containing protein [Sedimentisphaerales bacterium]
MNTFAKRILYFALFVVPLIALQVRADATLKVGVGKTDITPNEPMRLYGYSSRKAPYIGIYDPLFCRSVVFDDGQTQAAIISLDSGTIPLGHWLQTIRTHLAEKYGIDYVFLAATHSHAAPYLGTHDKPIPWNETIAGKIYKSVQMALTKMQNARFSIGAGEVDITYDRRVVNDDGSVTMLWQNHDRKPTKPVDQRIHVLHIRNTDEEPIATLVHYACHPVISGSRNNRVSAEIPGAVCMYVNKAIEGECIFLQGACGDINPYLAGYLQEDVSAYETLQKESEKVAREVIHIVHRATPVEQDDWAIHYQQKKVSFGLRHPVSDKRMKDLLNGFFSDEGLEYFLKTDQTLQANVTLLMLGKEIAWAGFPGEFFDDFQVDLRRRSPVTNTFFVGYCNGMYSYFPTIEAAAEGGYGASYGLLAEAGTGEHMVDKAVMGLYQLLGKL